MELGWLQLVGSLKWQVFFAKEPYKRDDILQRRPIILRSLLIVATPYQDICRPEFHVYITHMYVYMYIYVYVYVYVCIHIYICTCAYTYIYIYICIYHFHLNIYAYIHTCRCKYVTCRIQTLHYCPILSRKKYETCWTSASVYMYFRISHILTYNFHTCLYVYTCIYIDVSIYNCTYNIHIYFNIQNLDPTSRPDSVKTTKLNSSCGHISSWITAIRSCTEGSWSQSFQRATISICRYSSWNVYR